MDHTGVWSILPIVVAIACAVVTRQVILALFLGVYVGVLTIEGGHPLAALTSLIRDYLVVQLTDAYNVGVLVLLAFIGGFVALMERSGGATAFARNVSTYPGRGKLYWPHSKPLRLPAEAVAAGSSVALV